MNQQRATTALVLRDEAGTTYIVTSDIPDQARATANQEAELAGGDTAGFGVIIDFSQAPPPFQVVGMAMLPPAPLQPAPLRLDIVIC